MRATNSRIPIGSINLKPGQHILNNIIKAASSGNSPFDSILHTDPEGKEFWLARELMPVLGYQRWENFARTIRKAIRSCENVGNLVSESFCVILRNTDGRNSEDYQLSRYACYLVAMCGDPEKLEIAAAQSYFAIKTREAEINDRLNPSNAIDKLIEGLQDLKLLFGNQDRVDAIEHRLDHQEAEIGRIFQPDGQYFSIRGWAKQRKIKVNVEQAKAYGHVASRLSKKLGIPTDKLPDPRYGKVNAYHESVLVQIF